MDWQYHGARVKVKLGLRQVVKWEGEQSCWAGLGAETVSGGRMLLVSVSVSCVSCAVNSAF